MTTNTEIYEIVYNDLDLIDAQMNRRAYLRPCDFQQKTTADAATNTSPHDNLNENSNRSKPKLNSCLKSLKLYRLSSFLGG